ncbi:hypothetical protein [Aquimarina megaterium]|uniref:hypothetical protein n=1 Tax=Aquimarina megaterium TaxID=1443666 RepID=UPI0004718F3A|nr:hypothetical protein [Aquimarina megaterium]
MAIDIFCNNIKEFNNLSSSEQIDYFVYYLLIIKKQDGVKAKDISSCFDEMHLPPYSNIGSYLNRFSKKGKNQKFIKRTNGFYLERSKKQEIDLITNNKPLPKPSDGLYPQVLLENTRGYLLKIGEQASICYDIGLFDASLVMIRKLLETLIIECFERHGIEQKIKGNDNHYFFLSDLIDKFLLESKWSVNRNTARSLPKIKALGDLSAHNRKFSAKKPDIDKIRDDLRIVIEDLMHTIDYSNWNKS